MKSFKHAINGILKVIKNERNFKIHLVAIIIVTRAGFYFSISKVEWLIIILTMMFVTTLELINSAIEYLSNFVSPRFNENIKIIKDVSAGAVLTAAIGSVIIGLIIFIPYLIHFIQSIRA
jgi:undecaprenol kinase